MPILSTYVHFMFKKLVNIDMTDSVPIWLADKPWNQLPPLPPAAELETKAVLKQCITARVALARAPKAGSSPPVPAKEQESSSHREKHTLARALGEKLESTAGKADLFHLCSTAFRPVSLSGFCRGSLSR